MSVIVNMPAATISVTFPSGTTKTVNMVRLLAQTMNAEFKAKHGMFLPGVGKQHPTVKRIREEYEIPAGVCRTWAEAATLLRSFYEDLSNEVRKARL